MARVIVVAQGRGGLLLVNEQGRPRLPAANLRRGDNPKESAKRTLEQEGFIAPDAIQLGKMGKDQTLFWVENAQPATDDQSGEIWLPCGNNPVQALRKFASRCPKNGARIYRGAANLLKAHLRKSSIIAA